MIIDLQNLQPAEKQYYLQHVVAPRPICLASTIDRNGQVNLSPFSFFNMFSSNPPILIFSPARRVRDNTTKHTLENVREVPEVGIHIVTAGMVQQVSLASCEYPRGVNEFVKAGFTQQTADLIRPPLVKESPVKMECRVNGIHELGSGNGAGNLVICEVLRMHIDDALFEDGKKLDQRRFRQVARLGGDWYCVAGPENLFHVEKPNTKLGIGFDALPEAIRQSPVLTGNHLAQLANVHQLPEVDPSFEDSHLRQILQYYRVNPDELERELHGYARKLLDAGKVTEAWQVLLTAD